MIRRPHIARMLLFASLAAPLAATIGCEDRPETPRTALRPPNATATIGLIHHRANGTTTSDGPLEVDLADGGRLRVDALYLVISAVELHLCTDGERADLLDPWRWLVPSAYAHVPTSATRLGVPYVESLLDGKTSARIIDELAPPPGRYCRGYAVLAPADDDVVNLTDADRAELFGHTALIRGAVKLDEEGDWQPRTWTSDLSLPAPFELVDPRSGAGPLLLEDADDHVMLLVDKTVGPTLLEGLTRAQLDDGQAPDLIVERLAETFAIHRFAAPDAKDAP